MTKIVVVSDMHGHLPEVPECDILLIAGDIMLGASINTQLVWMEGLIKPWLKEIPAKEVVFVAGNHDTMYERDPHLVNGLQIPWTYLQDGFAIIRVVTEQISLGKI